MYLKASFFKVSMSKSNAKKRAPTPKKAKNDKI